MIHAIWNIPPRVDPMIQVEVDEHGEFVGPNANRTGSCLSLLACQPRYISLDYSDWSNFFQNKKDET